MIADLNTLQFDSSSFAKIICRERAIENLRDGTLYVVTANERDWEDAIVSLQNSIAKSKVKALWHLPYYIESVADWSLLKSDEKLVEYMEHYERDYNMIMPLYTPDRSSKCYFVGKIDLENIVVAFSFLTIDAQKVCDECSFAAFVTSLEIAPSEAKEVWMRLIDYNSRMMASGGQIAFRGKYNTSVSEYTFLGKGFEKVVNIPKMGYADLIDSLNKFPDTIEAISKSADNSSSAEHMEYVKICQNLSAVDKNELILELSKRIGDKKVLAEAIDAVMNKAKRSRLKIRLEKKASVEKIDGRRMYGDWCTYLVDENDKKQWLDFEPAAHVIYIMNLIYRIKNPNNPEVVDISKHREAFVSIYDAIYDGSGEEQYRRLVCNVEKKSGEGYERKRLKDCYKIITNCINVQCSFFNENPSAYIINLDKPLTIDPKLIEISETFKSIARLKGLF